MVTETPLAASVLPVPEVEPGKVALPKLPYVYLRDGESFYVGHYDDPRETWLNDHQNTPERLEDGGGAYIPSGERAAWIREALAFLQRYPETFTEGYCVVSLDTTGIGSPAVVHVAKYPSLCVEFVETWQAPSRRIPLILEIPREKQTPLEEVLAKQHQDDLATVADSAEKLAAAARLMACSMGPAR